MTTMLRQILIHARNSMSHSLRSGSGVVFIVLTILAGLALANLAFAPIELGFIELEQFRDNAAQGIGVVLSLATLQQGDPDSIVGRMESGELVEMTMWARYLVLEKPMLLSITVLLLGLVLPLLLPLGTYTAISGDVQHRSIRYLPETRACAPLPPERISPPGRTGHSGMAEKLHPATAWPETSRSKASDETIRGLLVEDNKGFRALRYRRPHS